MRADCTKGVRRPSRGFCLTVNPGFAGGAYGYVNMGPYKGGQAEHLRVPFADFNCLELPEGEDHEATTSISSSSTMFGCSSPSWPLCAW